VRFPKTLSGLLCRDCISSKFWSFTLITLLLGWWGVISFFVNIGSLLGNLGAWSKFHSLAAPDEAHTVALDPGPPLYRRGGIWFAAIAIAILASMAASEASQEEDYSVPSYTRSTTGGVYTPSYGSYSGGSSPLYTTTTASNIWTASDMAELRSAAVRAGLDYSDATCVVRYLTNRYSPSEYIPQSAVSNAADYCL